MMTRLVATKCTLTSAHASQVRQIVSTANTHHSAQATWRDGMAANSLAWAAMVAFWVALPNEWVTTPMSTYPSAGIIRGGATGYSQYTTSPIAFMAMSALRSTRNRLGCFK